MVPAKVHKPVIADGPGTGGGSGGREGDGPPSGPGGGRGNVVTLARARRAGPVRGRSVGSAAETPLAHPWVTGEPARGHRVRAGPGAVYVSLRTTLR
jgi:hypothetical protein